MDMLVVGINSRSVVECNMMAYGTKASFSAKSVSDTKSATAASRLQPGPDFTPATNPTSSTRPYLAYR